MATRRSAWHGSCFPVGMLHFVARSRPGALLYTTWEEGLLLWRLVHRHVPGVRCGVLMPDHLHLLHLEDCAASLAAAMRAYARSRNARRGSSGSVWAPAPAGERLLDAAKVRRCERYVYLNPCRAGLVGDPLQWPLSTYRDALGLATCPVRPRVADRARLHAYVSGDPSVSVAGTPLPATRAGRLSGSSAANLVRAAVSEVTRTPLGGLTRRGPARALLVRSLRALTELGAGAVAEVAGVSRASVHRASVHDDVDLRRVRQVLGDPRFPGLLEGDLRTLPGWRRYAGRR